MELEPSKEETQRTVYLVGGPRHGQEVTIPANQQSYLDIASAQTYYLQHFVKPKVGPLGVPTMAYVRYAMVHESFRQGRNPAEVVQLARNAQFALADIITGKWFEEGDEVPMETRFVPGPPTQNGGQPNG